jgi:hypothetical protein
MILGVAGLVIVGIIFSFVAGALPEVDMLTKIKHFAVKTIAVVRSHVILVSLFKLVLVGVLGYTLWVRVAGMLEGGVHLGAFIRRGGVLFWVVVLLMPVNWFLELVKWKRLVGRNQDLSYGVALRGLLLGVALSVITPNRLGELGGAGIGTGTIETLVGFGGYVVGECVFISSVVGFWGSVLVGFWNFIFGLGGRSLGCWFVVAGLLLLGIFSYTAGGGSVGAGFFFKKSSGAVVAVEYVFEVRFVGYLAFIGYALRGICIAVYFAAARDGCFVKCVRFFGGGGGYLLYTNRYSAAAYNGFVGARARRFANMGILWLGG